MWKEDVSYLLSVVKEFIVKLCELGKYGSNACPSLYFDSTGWVMEVLIWGKNGGSGKLNDSDCVVGRNGGNGESSVEACTCTCTRTSNVGLSVDVCGSAHCSGCVVNGSNAKAAF